MMDLIARLDDGGYSCVVANGGVVRCFEQRGVADLHALLHDEPDFLLGSQIADKVVGKGAAAIMVSGGVRQLYSHVVSDGAMELFEGSGVEVAYGKRVPHIINRDGSDWCPVEKMCRDAHGAEAVLELVDRFVNKMKNR